MNHDRPGIIATKTVNQYRRRDSFAYTALRYLLRSSVASSDYWAETIAPELVLRGVGGGYFHSIHFKEFDLDRRVETRTISVPAPVNAIAESALLRQCSEAQEMALPKNVYAYHLSDKNDRSGTFVNYVKGLRLRHSAITNACIQRDDVVVRQIDIKKFYPSVPHDVIRKAWTNASNHLPEKWAELGDKFICDQLISSKGQGNGLLTGPHFSHFLANLVLKDIDLWAESVSEVKYFRYVDDITLVGPVEKVDSFEKEVASRLLEVGLHLHPEGTSKHFTVNAREWLEGSLDYADSGLEGTWAELVASTRRFTLFNPKEVDALSQNLLDEGFRLPLIDFSAAAREYSYLDSVTHLMQFSSNWLRSKMLSRAKLVETAKTLRNRIETEFCKLVDDFDVVDDYTRKRMIPKLRFRAGRLIYLSDANVLSNIAKSINGRAEFELHSSVMLASATGDLSEVVSMGVNAVQAASQSVRAGKVEPKLGNSMITDVEMQGLTVLSLNGLFNPKHIEFNGDTESSQMFRIANGIDAKSIVKSGSEFASTFALLVGNDGVSTDFICKAFDESDQLILDAVENFEQSAPPS